LNATVDQRRQADSRGNMYNDKRTDTLLKFNRAISAMEAEIEKDASAAESNFERAILMKKMR
jgi:hypothetical protein